MKKYILPIALILFAASCKKSEDGGVAGWSTATYGPNLLSLYSPIAPAEQVFTVNTTYIDTLTTTSGIRFVIPDHSFAQDNNAVAFGNVTVKIHEYFDNAALFSGGVGTATADGQLLITSGMFNISVTDTSNRELRLAKLISVSVPDGGNPNTNNRIFVQRYILPLVPTGITDPNLVNWGLDSTTWKQAQHGAGSFYDFSIYQLNWWNLDRFADMGQGTTEFSVKLPEGYGNTNTVVALLTPQKGLVRLYGDVMNHQFTTGNYKVPIGLAAKVICIAKQGSEYSYSLKTVTVTAGQMLTVDKMETITETALQGVIQNNLN